MAKIARKPTSSPHSVSEKTRLNKVKAYQDSIFKNTETFTDLCRMARDTLKSDTAAIALLDGESSRLVAFHGAYSPELPRAQSLSREVVELGRTIIVPDVSLLPNKVLGQAMRDNGIRAYVAAPLTVSRGLHIGSFFVSYASPKEFSDSETKMVERLADFAVSMRSLDQFRLRDIAVLAQMKDMLIKIVQQKLHLQRDEKLLSHVSKLAGIGGWELDVATMKTTWSKQVYAIHEVEDQPSFDLSTAINFYPGEAAKTVSRLVGEAISTGKPFEFELPLITAKGANRLVRSMGEAEVVNGKVVRLFGTFQDVTDQRAAEKLMIQMQKMDAIGQVTGGIVHDFNNLLAVIIGNLQLFLKNTSLAPQAREHVVTALAAANRGVATTRQLMTFARMGDPIVEAVETAALVQGLTPILRQSCGPGGALSVNAPLETWPIMSDAAQLETALLNLVINARDASPQGAEIHMATSNIPAAQDIPDLAAPGTRGDYVCISVSDKGQGIPKSIIDKITEPFFTTKKTGKGTGLGLSIVNSFAERSGGKLSVASEEGAGTTVSLYLPRLPVGAGLSSHPSSALK